jgi:MSHA biogenesis protein MshM
MYTQHFGLRELPFGITPDTGFFFNCSNYQVALNTLLVAAVSGEGFIKITGEVGTGKTILCRKFMAMLDDSYVTAYILNPYLEPRSLMMALADELEIVLDRDVEQHQLLKVITHRLLSLAQDGKKVVLCLDEAQAMPLETLEALRLLTNLETEKRKLLQIVLFGQPELDDKLQKDTIRQLTQRITFHYHLSPLSRDDLEFYIAHRLHMAGYSDKPLFSRGGMKFLHKASKGIPRLANILAHKALMLAFGEGVKRIDTRHIKEAAKDTVAVNIGFGIWRWIGAMSVFFSATSISWMYLK